MNGNFNAVIAASGKERRDVFVGAATRLDTAVQNVEKDFWVGWVLDALFNGLRAGGPRLLFKGGTSLSKGFGLISRLRQWHAKRGELRHAGQRVSRHYYDVYRLMQADADQAWRKDQVLAADCARHARMFFGSPDLGLNTASAGNFTLVPDEAMRGPLAKDYDAMAGMIFGEVPRLDDVLTAISELEMSLNKAAATFRG